jgi:GTP-binding protein HflX
MAKSNTPALFVSALKRENIEDLKKTLYEEVKKIHITRFPYNDFLYDSNWTVNIEQS